MRPAEARVFTSRKNGATTTTLPQGANLSPPTHARLPRSPFYARLSKRRHTNLPSHARAFHFAFVSLPLLPKIKSSICISASFLRKQVEGKCKKAEEGLRQPPLSSTHFTATRTNVGVATATNCGSKRKEKKAFASTDKLWRSEGYNPSSFFASTCLRSKQTVYQHLNSFCGGKTAKTKNRGGYIGLHRLFHGHIGSSLNP